MLWYQYSAGMTNGPRLYNAAPGAEARYRNGSIGSANGMFTGSSLFPNRSIANRRFVITG